MKEKEFALGKSTLEGNKRTQVWRVRGPEDPRIREAGRILREGGLVAFPTETVYGLGANGLDGGACSRIYAAKGRPSDNPLILHVDSLEMAKGLAREWPEKARRVANKLWPGPLTMIVPAAACVPRQVTAGLDTVAIRFPSDAVAQALIEAAGVPIAAPSANLSGRPSPTTAGHVLEDLGGRIDVILDGGPCAVGLESTIIDLSVEPPAVLRPGDITEEALAQLLGPLAGAEDSGPADTEITSQARVGTEAAGQTRAARGTEAAAGEAGRAQGPKAPGMKYRHYAPKAPVTILQGKPAAVALYVWQRLVNGQENGAEPAGEADSPADSQDAAAAPDGVNDAASGPAAASRSADPATGEVSPAAPSASQASGKPGPAAAKAESPAESPAAWPKTALLLSGETWRLLERWGFEARGDGTDWFCRDMGGHDRPREIAARLYDALRACDGQRAERIFVEGVSQAGQGAAVMNRLKKAAGNQVLKLN